MSKKKILIDLLVTHLSQELEAMNQSARAAYEAAIHEESKPEDSHDTRGLEASYLAGAQMARMENLKKTITAVQFTDLRAFTAKDSIAIGALIELEFSGKKQSYFLVPQGGGKTLQFEGKSIQVITPQTPMGELLLGEVVGNVIEIEVQKNTREYLITGIA